jgi:hypothetical protein
MSLITSSSETPYGSVSSSAHQHAKLGEPINPIMDEHGKLQGIYVKYHDNGKIQERCFYIDDKRHGLYTSYYDNGNVYEQITFEHGVYHGQYISHYYNGNVYEQVTFEHGKRHGLYTSHHDNGNVYEQITFEHGVYIEKSCSISVLSSQNNILPSMLSCRNNFPPPLSALSSVSIINKAEIPNSMDLPD